MSPKIVFHSCYLATTNYYFKKTKNIKRFLIKKIHDSNEFLSI